LSDHAVSASTVYLIRSLGTVWGVSVTSAIVQTTLTTRLPSALHGIPHEDDVSSPLSAIRNAGSPDEIGIDCAHIIDQIRHSVDAIHHLAPEAQLKARLVYYDGLRYAFAASTAVACLGIVAALFASASGLRKTHK
jgi:hypothetical protein